MKYTTLFLDLDGTLMDSGEGIMRCAQYALQHFGIHVDDWRTLRFFVGPPLEDSFVQYYGFTADEAERATEVYRERFFTLGKLEQHPYDGAADFLKAMHEEGVVVCIATSKLTVQAHFSLEHFGLSPYVDHIFGRGDAGERHTKAEVIAYGLRQLAITDPSQVLMVGDRCYDIEGAQACGLHSAGVLYGYGDEEELRQAGATYICRDFNDIAHIVNQNH